MKVDGEEDESEQCDVQSRKLSSKNNSVGANSRTFSSSSPTPAPSSASYQPFASTSSSILSSGIAGITSGLSTLNQVMCSSFPFPLQTPSSPAPTDTLPYPAHPPSPINLSTEAITAAAYLLAYPSYTGNY